MVGPNIIKNKKEVIKIFISFGLSVALTTNAISANYLDVNFDLARDINKPYRKPNDEPFYTNKHSNHLPPKHCTTDFKNFQYFFKPVNI